MLEGMGIKTYTRCLLS